ncbi:hypothetical protein BJ742DRAFT_819020 [Cladochytrium replicatum]|nr:hypothetical protein BJ742DRAFT_819020 [Cladochytrium replicatum]
MATHIPFSFDSPATHMSLHGSRSASQRRRSSALVASRASPTPRLSGAIIENLLFSPLPGHSTLVFGYLGITDAVKIHGIVSWEATSDFVLVSLSVTLRGYEQTHIDNHVETKDFVRKTVILSESESTHPDYNDSDPYNNAEVLPAGFHSFPFALGLEDGLELPASHAGEGHGAGIYYSLSVDLVVVDTAPSIWQTLGFAPTPKTFTIEEEVDLPKLHPPTVIRSMRPGALHRVVHDADQLLDIRCEVSPAAFGLGQPVNVILETLVPQNPIVSIARINVTLVQGHIVRSKSTQRIFEDVIAFPTRSTISSDPVLVKFIEGDEVETTPADSGDSELCEKPDDEQSAATAAGADDNNATPSSPRKDNATPTPPTPNGTGQQIPFPRPPSFHSTTSTSVLSPPPTPPPLLTHHPANTSIIYDLFSGECSLSVESPRNTRRRDRDHPHSLVDVYPTFDSELVSVYHEVRVSVQLDPLEGMYFAKVPTEVTLKIPVVVFDADEETRRWVVKNFGGETGLMSPV